jgi:hypothetical protein
VVAPADQAERGRRTAAAQDAGPTAGGTPRQRIALLLVTGTSALSTDTYISSLPEVQASLHTSSSLTQLTMPTSSPGWRSAGCCPVRSATLAAGGASWSAPAGVFT